MMLKRTGSSLFVLILILLIIILISQGSISEAGEISIEANLSHGVIGLDDTVVYSIKVESNRQNIDFDIKPPSFEKFDLISTSRSSSISIVNNVLSRGIVNNYVLKPKEAGEFVLSGASVIYENREYDVKEISITVKEGSVVRSHPRHSMPQTDPFDSFFDMRRRDRPGRLSQDDAFVEMSVNNSNPYIYEQVILTISFYKKPHVIGEASLEPVQIPDVWLEELDQNTYQDVGYTYRDNQRYVLHKIHYVIYPVKTGLITIPGARINLSPSSFFSASPVPVALDSKSAELNVKPLPGGRILPAGEFTLNVMIQKGTEYFQDQAVIMTVIAEGAGRLRDDDIAINNTSGKFEIYPPTKSTQSEFSANKYRTKYKYEYILIPLESGALRLPEVFLEFFDPVMKKTRSIKSKEMIIDVNPPSGTASRNASQHRTFISDRGDIMYLMQYKPQSPKPVINLRGVYILQLVLLLSALISIATGMKKSNRVYRANAVRRKAIQNDKKRLLRLDITGNRRDVSREALSLFHSYLDSSLGIKTGSLTKPELLTVLKENKMGDNLCESIVNVLEDLNEQIYNPGEKSKPGLTSILKSIRDIMEKGDI